jgi:aminodeoxyfutalosine deaminase
MRKISAHYVFPVCGEPIKNGIVTISDDGIILDVEKPDFNIDAISNLEFYNGILVPGFVNAHCHVELSYLKNNLDRKTGLHNFISAVSNAERPAQKVVLSVIDSAVAEMKKEGIVAVGDISNTDVSLSAKSSTDIYFHTFVEVFGLNPAVAKEKFEKGLGVLKKFQNKQLSCSLTLHAPYSASIALFDLFKMYNHLSGSIFSIHNQESIEEKALFNKKNGLLFDTLMLMQQRQENMIFSDKTSLEFISEYFDKGKKILFVHNIYSSEIDIRFLLEAFTNAFFCFCPKSNLYIEERLPDIEMMRCFTEKITIGTDSLASNDTLSILEELKTIQTYYPVISFGEMLRWACINGADLLDVSDKLGSIEKGKKPGLVNIESFDFENMALTEKSVARRIC